MSIEKDKKVFQDKLKGNWIPEDIFGTPMVVGEILLYATGGGGSAISWRVGKILEVVVKENEWGDVTHKLKMRRAEQGWRVEDKKWELMAKPSYLTNVHNAFVLTHPEPEVAKLFKDVK